MRIATVICSVGRPDCIAEVLPWLARQTKAPSDVVLVVTKPEDLPPKDALAIDLPVEILFSEKGLPRQRNRALDALTDRCDTVLFIDDDYLPAQDALSGIERILTSNPSIAGVTGHLLADGIHSGGVSFADAAGLIRTHEERPTAGKAASILRRNLVGLYGCNMAYRMASIGSTRFDERLPLYAWQEDVDFASRLDGEKVKTDALVGVHCGVRSGRETSGHLLGYSQVANPVYLLRKGSLPRGFALNLMRRNVVSNHVKSIRPEPWIDRRARARGNRLAMLDLLRGRSDPERILDIA